MHLEKPAAVLAEMKRVTKPGGLVVCKEPDNLSWWLSLQDCSLPEPSPTERLLGSEIYLLANKGRKKLGRGDRTIGVKLARMMRQAGLLDVNVRINDAVGDLAPPYDSERQRGELETIKANRLNPDFRKKWFGLLEEEYLAGGGDPEKFYRFRALSDERDKVMQAQVEAGEYYICGTEFFYVCRGTKPVCQ
jgi:hypothetical protein